MNAARGSALGLLLTAIGATAWAADPPCEPGFRWAEEVRTREVVRYECKVVPDVKKVKKVVYAAKDDPFCLRAATGHKPACGDADCGGSCPACRGPFPRKILVKTEIITEEPTTKCVVEKVVETVEYRVKCQVPCDPTGNPPAILPRLLLLGRTAPPNPADEPAAGPGQE